MRASSDIAASRRLEWDGQAIRAEQAFAAIVCVTLLAAAGVMLSSSWSRTLLIPQFPFVPIATTWAIFDLLTAAFLFARLYVSGRLLFGWVGAAYGCSGLLTIAYIAAYLRLLDPGHNTVGDQQMAAALYIAWHALFAILVPIGVVSDVRSSYRVPRARAAFAAGIAIAGVVAAVVLIVAALFMLRSELPVFALNGVMEPSLATAMKSIAALGGVAFVVLLIARRHRLYGLALWLCIAALTSMLEATLNAISPHLFSAAWDLGKVFTLSTSSFVMIQTLVTTFRAYVWASEHMAVRWRDAGARLRAIWQIATSEGLGERDHLQLILDLATANLRSRHSMFGFASELENGVIRITAVSRHGNSSLTAAAAGAWRTEAPVPADDELHNALYAVAATMIWEPPGDLPPGITQQTGWRYAIGTMTRVGAKAHFLVFGTQDELGEERFVESDIAFVEIVASIINQRHFEREQFRRIEFQSEHDPLTSSYNRAAFRRIGNALFAEQSLSGVILIDFDGFTEVNHRVGQMRGDRIIIDVAASLERVDLRNVVARIGGDEFGILVLAPPEGTRPDIQASVAAYQSVFRPQLEVTVSIGVAALESSDSAFEPLLSRAAVALEDAWNRGGNSVSFFGPELEARLEQRSVERTELMEAMQSDALFLEYQPTFELNTHTITGAEALVRWQHATRGVISPNMLLPAIRRANLLPDLTFWVMRRVARDFGALRLPAGFRCFFNVPSQVLENESFINSLNQLLFMNPDLGAHLGIEVTESDVMHNVEQAIVSLNRARQYGLMVAVDDFGTGYSSLNYVKRLPVDVIKLDKSFIDGLPDDRRDVALAELFLQMSHQFGFVSAGEGIETEAQAEWLRSHGCMIGQGYLFSKPIAHHDLMSLVCADDTHVLES